MSRSATIIRWWWQNKGARQPFVPPVFRRPSAPRLGATAGHERITLRWDRPADGGQPILRYERRRTNNAGNFLAWADIGLVLTEVITGLDNGQNYTFEVRAVNSVGDGVAASVMATPVSGRAYSSAYSPAYA